MTRYNIREFQEDDIAVVGANARQADIDELWAASHVTPPQALMQAFLVSRDTMFTGEINGEPICVFGVKEPSALSDLAQPWLIGTEGINFHSRAFARFSRDVVDIWKQRYPYMYNYVDARNTAAIRWLDWVGFALYKAEPYGVDGLPFHLFDTET